MQLLTSPGWNVVKHSSDLAVSDFHLFFASPEAVDGRKEVFPDDVEVKNAVRDMVTQRRRETPKKKNSSTSHDVHRSEHSAAYTHLILWIC